MKGKVDYRVDIRGMIPPFSLLKVSLVFQQMKPFQVVEIIGCDPDMQRDLFRILPEASYKVICTENQTENMELSRVRLEKRNPIEGASLKRKFL